MLGKYVVLDHAGNTYPVPDVPTLRQWVTESRVVSTTQVIDNVSHRTVLAKDLPELQDLFPVAAYAMPPSGQPAYPRQAYSQVAQKSKIAAILLAFFLGGLGIHRFYLGHTGTGIAMLLITILTCGYGSIITGIWALVDLILIATDSLGDASGAPLS